MATRTKKTAEPAPAPAVDIDELVNAGEPIVEIVESDERQAPATAPLDAPEVPEGRPEVEAAQRADNFEFGGPIVESDGPVSVLIDAATGEKPADPEAVFALEFQHGRSLVCQIRLLEDLYLPGLESPVSRLVLAEGMRVDIDRAEMLKAKLVAQLEG